MNETTKIEKLKEARELGLTLEGSSFSERGMINVNTEFHIQKTMNKKTWNGSMKCGERIGKENSIDYYDTLVNNATRSAGKLFIDGVNKVIKVIDLVCTDCLEKI